MERNGKVTFRKGINLSCHKKETPRPPFVKGGGRSKIKDQTHSQFSGVNILYFKLKAITSSM